MFSHPHYVCIGGAPVAPPGRRHGPMPSGQAEGMQQQQQEQEGQHQQWLQRQAPPQQLPHVDPTLSREARPIVAQAPRVLYLLRRLVRQMMWTLHLLWDLLLPLARFLLQRIVTQAPGVLHRLWDAGWHLAHLLQSTSQVRGQEPQQQQQPPPQPSPHQQPQQSPRLQQPVQQTQQPPQQDRGPVQVQQQPQAQGMQLQRPVQEMEPQQQQDAGNQPTNAAQVGGSTEGHCPHTPKSAQ